MPVGHYQAKSCGYRYRTVGTVDATFLCIVLDGIRSAVKSEVEKTLC
jgi:hypothetical protein